MRMICTKDSRYPHSFVYRDDLKAGTGEVPPAHTLSALIDVFRTTDFNPARRSEHVEIAEDDDVVGFAILQHPVDFAVMAAFGANQQGFPHRHNPSPNFLERHLRQAAAFACLHGKQTRRPAAASRPHPGLLHSMVEIVGSVRTSFLLSVTVQWACRSWTRTSRRRSWRRN